MENSSFVSKAPRHRHFATFLLLRRVELAHGFAWSAATLCFCRILSYLLICLPDRLIHIFSVDIESRLSESSIQKPHCSVCTQARLVLPTEANTSVFRVDTATLGSRETCLSLIMLVVRRAGPLPPHCPPPRRPASAAPSDSLSAVENSSRSAQSMSNKSSHAFANKKMRSKCVCRIANRVFSLRLTLTTEPR